MHLMRARFAGDIIAEIAEPMEDRGRVMVLCDGMPTVPSKKAVMEFWAGQGYWVIHPRYRGSWESRGEFLEVSPVQDILDVIEHIHFGFTSIWDNKKITVTPKEIIVLGSSFGGAAALLSSASALVTKVVALSPVVDWTAESHAEPLDWLYSVVTDSFGEGYRVSKKNWDKLNDGLFFNPIAHMDRIVGEKILIVHAVDDVIVLPQPVSTFAVNVGAQLITKEEGGHFSASQLLEDDFIKIIKKFITYGKA